MKQTNYYAILSIPITASDEEIDDAYRKAIKIYHPDNYSGYIGLNEDFGETMKEVNEAYEILKDRDKKQKYDEKLRMDEEFTNEYNNHYKIRDKFSLENYKEARYTLKQELLDWHKS